MLHQTSLRSSIKVWLTVLGCGHFLKLYREIDYFNKKISLHEIGDDCVHDSNKNRGNISTDIWLNQ